MSIESRDALVDLVRSADPARDPGEVPAFTTLVLPEDETASSSAPQRPRRRLAVAGAALGTVAVATLVVTLSSDGGRLSVVAQARAALSPGEQILHVVAQTDVVFRHPSRVDTGSGPQTTTQVSTRSESWSADAPLRYRTTSRVRQLPDGREGDPVETDYADGVARTASPADGTLRVARIHGLTASAFLAGVRADGAGGEPDQDRVAVLRKMLADGQLRSAGTDTYDGRSVQRLVATDLATAGRDRSEQVASMEYLVDADSFVPVRIQLSMAPSSSLVKTATTTFATYERVPATGDNARLLRLGDAVTRGLRPTSGSDQPTTKTLQPLAAPDDGQQP